MKKAIVIGASSGIGRALAVNLSKSGYIVGITARRTPLLTSLQQEMPNPSIIKPFDISSTELAMNSLNELIAELDGVDLIVISAGTGYINPMLDWEKELDTINVNVLGVSAMINTAIHYFLQRNAGHLVVISSIAGLRGSSVCPAYNASKAYLSNYVEGVRCSLTKAKSNVCITDIRPGLVDTAMAQGDGLFWVQPVQKAVDQITRSIQRKKQVVYITKRWAIIAFLLKRIPRWIYRKIG